MVYIVFVIIFIIYQHKHIDFFDIVILITSLIVLAINLAKYNGLINFKGINGYGDIEMYVNNAKEPDYNDIQPLSLDENFSEMIKITKIYLTSHNKKSYPGSGLEWFNVAYKHPKEQCKVSDNHRFVFANSPTYSRKNGIMLGSNRLIGPLSNNLDISLQSTFTIFFCCKHGDFNTNDKEVELLKLYANSNDNNGLSLFIKSNSIEINNNIQTGRLMFKFVDDDSISECLLNPLDSSLTFDKLNMSLYFIVKDIDKIRILYMVGGSQTVYQLALITTKETVATFSNKELIINRFQNWKGNLYQFGIMDTAASDQLITNIYQHCYGEYLKATNEDFLKLTSDYNSMLEYLKRFTSCPYDTDVCKRCQLITKWNDTTQLLTAPQECKDAISTFCKINNKHSLCRCWDTSYVGYRTDACKAYRSIFDVNNRIFDNLSLDDLNYVKDKYNLLRPEDCPKTTPINCVNEKLKKNSYIPYEFDKIKIKPKSLDMDEADVLDSKKIDSLYETDVTSKTVEAEKDKVLGKHRDTPKSDTTVKNEYKEISVNKDDMKKYRSSESEGVMVKNIYQNDLDINIDKKINPTTDDQPIEKTAFVDKLINMFLPA